MKVRLAVAAGLAGVMAFAGVSQGASKACNLLVDDKGDANGFVNQGVMPNSIDSLDIISGDIATNAKALTAVMRVTKLSKTDSSSPLGLAYYFNFTVGDVTLFATALTTPSGDRFGAGYIGATRTSLAGEVTGAFDEGKNEVRIHVPLSVFAPQVVIKPGSKFLDLNALGQRFVGAYAPAAQHRSAGATPTADVAESTKTYTASARSCVAVGK